jgi:DNA-binding Lrp family transcriptional regulator
VNELVKLDKVDRELLQWLQDEFPMEKRPWAEVGKRLGISEEEVLSRVKRLSSDGVIRKLRTILDAQKLDLCSSTLLAMKVPKDKMEEVVSIVNEYMSVTHNYRREHDYNLWFTITTCGDKDLRSTVEEIKRRTGVPDSDILDLPTARIFKIDVRFQFTNARGKGGEDEYEHILGYHG